MKKLISLLLISVLLAINGFATENPYVRNGVNGAIVGGGIGAVIGNNTGKGDAKKGAIIGAAIGTIFGVNNTRSSSYPRGGVNVSMGQLDRDITDASRQYAADQAEADRLQAFADAAQRRASEVRSRLYDLQSARDSLIRASR